MAATFPLPRLTASLFPADILVVLTAASLPWSTSLPAIFIGLWLIALLPVIDTTALWRSFKHPALITPFAFFALAVLGTLWSGSPWSTRLYYVGPLAKLLVIPLLIYQFQRSSRGVWVFSAFLISCTLLMIMSWIVDVDPQLAFRTDAPHGVPVKNYIDQSQEFALCAVAVLYAIVFFFNQRRYVRAAYGVLIATGFVANMMFVVVSRTALITMPVMLGIFAFLHLSRRNMIAILGGFLAVTAALWFISPNLRSRTISAFAEYQAYERSNQATSVGLRLEFWRKSFTFFREAPFTGHGTGSVGPLFAQSAVGQQGAAAEAIANPHNQTLYVAIQWGSMGIIVLYAMWLCHLLLFRGTGLPHWIGLLVVAQNMMTSLFNSHLFDFHEGWMYVLGVGVAGGMVLADKTSVRPYTRPLGSV